MREGGQAATLADGRVLLLLEVVVVVMVAAVTEPFQCLRCWWRREFLLLSPPSALRIWSC